MISRLVLETIATCEAPATSEEIQTAQTALHCQFPLEYTALLRCANGLAATNVESLVLYSTLDVPERNQTFEVGTYMPSFLLIGDDGGGRGILIECGKEEKSNSPVFLLGMGAFGINQPTQLTLSLGDWIARGFPLSP